MKLRTNLVPPAAILALLLAAGNARAQFVQAPPVVVNFETSIRAAAMGGAGAAVGWGEPDVWAQPASLSGVRGIGWLQSRTKVLPGLDDDIIFTSRQLLLGGSGVGVSLMGEPFPGVGRSRLDFGGFPVLGGAPFYQQVDGLGVGVSPLRLVDAYRGTPGVLTSRGELSLGFESNISRFVVGDLTGVIAETYNWGLSGRLALARWWGPDAPFRLDFSGAFSQINRLRPKESPFAEPPTRFDRFGAALRLAPAAPAERPASPPALPWWRPGDAPTISFGIAYDYDQRRDGGSDEVANIHHIGGEMTLLRLLSLRVGYVSDHTGEVQGVTYGAGVTLPVGPWGSVAYDYADVPLASGLDRQQRHGWAVWVQPFQIWHPER
jgi:hypothetical protein